jgi:hypothetical protein
LGLLLGQLLTRRSQCRLDLPDDRGLLAPRGKLALTHLLE